LAQRLEGEIISVDSMQVYRGMDVGTAKPSPQDRAQILHHLVDVVDITTPFHAAQFIHLAQQAVRDIRSRGRLPILCGGTGLYFKAFFDGLGQAPAGNKLLRAQLEATPLPVLLCQLAERDPVAYQQIDRSNPRRVIRALEVVQLTGKPYAEQRADWTRSNPENFDEVAFFGLIRDSRDLQQRIEARVDVMFNQGLVNETRYLLDRGLNENHTALQALGYRQVVEYLAGTRSLPETVALVKTRTRQFAKRQMTWFRRQLPVQWLQVASEESTDQVANHVLERLSTRTASNPA
jgi:tRNA dimethylallyltransferase